MASHIYTFIYYIIFISDDKHQDVEEEIIVPVDEIVIPGKGNMKHLFGDNIKEKSFVFVTGKLLTLHFKFQIITLLPFDGGKECFLFYLDCLFISHQRSIKTLEQAKFYSTD